MIERISSISSAGLLELIKKLPNQPMVQGMLEKNNHGFLFSNKPERYVLIRNDGGYTFLAGHLENQDLNAVFNLLNSYEEIKLVCDESYHNWFIERGYTICPRIQLLYSGKELKPTEHKSYIIQEINSLDIFKNCQWFDIISKCYGSAEVFLQNGFGYVLRNNDDSGEIIGEVYAAFLGGGFCEVGITTHPDYQGQGVATNIACYLIIRCIRDNLIPIWSCNYENLGSLKVALKVGFVINRYYAFLKKQ